MNKGTLFVIASITLILIAVGGWMNYSFHVWIVHNELAKLQPCVEVKK